MTSHIYPNVNSDLRMQLSFYYFVRNGMTDRTKRYLWRVLRRDGTRPVLPLLTLLQKVLNNLESSIRCPRVPRPISNRYRIPSFDSNCIGNGKTNISTSDYPSPFSDEVRLEVRNSCHGGNRQHSFTISLGDLFSLPKNETEQSQLKKLAEIVQSRLPKKSKFVIKKLYYEDGEKLYFLLECSDIFENELKIAFMASKRKKTSRRRRGRRGRKRAKRNRKAGGPFERARDCDKNIIQSDDDDE